MFICYYNMFLAAVYGCYYDLYLYVLLSRFLSINDVDFNMIIILQVKLGQTHLGEDIHLT